jgi:predicted amidophosphoribosyltransferase
VALALLRVLAGVVGDLFAPRTCALCDEPAPESPCDRCRARLVAPPARRLVDGAPILAAQPYVAPVADAVRRLKYERRVDVVPTLARLVAPLVAQLAARSELCLVPVPLHPHRLAERGFNQRRSWRGPSLAEWCREPARAARCRRRPRALPDAGDRAPGAAIARRATDGARRRFAAAGSARLGGRAVVLLDDVVTTRGRPPARASPPCGRPGRR